MQNAKTCDAAIKAAVVAAGDALRAGEEVTRAALLCGALGVVGVRNVTNVLVGLSALGVADADLPMSPRQVAALDVARVTVTRV